MINVSLYRAGDSFEIDLIPGVFEPQGFLRASTDSLCTQSNVIAHTVRKGEKVIAIFGFVIIWPGVVEVWSLMSKEMLKTPLALVKLIQGGMKFYQKHLHVRRYQMTVKNDEPRLHKWARFLGFEFEGVMKAWGPDGSDFAIYGRVF